MKAAILSDIYKVEIKEVEKPKINKNEVLIKVKSTGICGSDLHAYRGHHPFRKPPVILGHEVSGIVEEIGDEVKNININDRVTVEPQLGCGNCEYCFLGKYNLCIDRKAPGIGDWNGTFAEYFVVCEKAVFKLTDQITYDEGALIEPLAVGVHAVRKTGIKLGDTVAILGGGTIGLTNLIAARNAGATKIFITDFIDYNLEKARQLGADYTINPNKENVCKKIKEIFSYGVNKVIITAAFEPVWKEALSISKKGANICIVGMFNENVQVDFLDMLMTEKSIITSWLYLREDFVTAIDIAKKVKLNLLITHNLKLEDAQKGLEKMDKRKENIIKIILNPF